MNFQEKEKLPEKLYPMIEHFVSVAQKTFLDINVNGNKTLVPIFIVGNSFLNEFATIAASFGNDLEKQEAIQDIRKVSKELGANFSFSILESWCLSGEDSQNFEKTRDKYPTVSSHPNKKDCVFFILETWGGTWGATALITTHPDGHREMGEIDFFRGHYKGILTGILEKVN